MDFPSQYGKSGKFLKTSGNGVLWDDTLPVQAGSSGKYLKSNGVTSSWDTPSASVASTEVVALIDPQVNISSEGDSYTDVAGNTYAETTHQTRITLTNSRIRQVSMLLSGHVSAGTGTYELYNNTDGSSLGTKTTTQISETAMTVATSILSTNKGDNITIRVKNSGAGGITYIDHGGLQEGDATAAYTATGYDNGISSPSNGWLANSKWAILTNSSADTFTAQIFCSFKTSADNDATAGATDYNVGANFSQTVHGTVITRTPVIKCIPSRILVRCSAISGGVRCAVGIQVKEDNI